VDVSDAPVFSSAEIEVGRALFAREWHFVSAADSPPSLPAERGVEIAFAGRSNVGKSSLINALVGQGGLARTSNTPGRTQELLFFAADGTALKLVDMPGYGYAAAPKQKIKAWTGLIRAYLQHRANLARVYVLIDARHGMKDTDQSTLDLLGEAAVSHQIVLTKADAIAPAELAACAAETQSALAKRSAAFPEILVTSARGGMGIFELRATIARLMYERSR